MKISKAEQNSGISRKLIISVIRQLGGRESLQDIRNNGIDGGFHGFTYYTETVAFFKRNRKDIAALVKQMADELGESPLDMVVGFRCLAPADEATKESIARCIYGGRLSFDGPIADDRNDVLVANALAWFAAEEVARAFENRD